MARIRSIKPDYWSSGKQLRVSADAALLNIALWGRADDEGRMNDDDMEIGACCPRFCGKVPTLLRELEKVKLIHRYTVGEKRFIQVHDWAHHQRISKPRPSSIPPMSSATPGTLPERSATIPGTLPERSTGKGSGSGREGRGSGKEVDNSKGDEFSISVDNFEDLPVLERAARTFRCEKNPAFLDFTAKAIDALGEDRVAAAVKDTTGSRETIKNPAGYFLTLLKDMMKRKGR